MSSSHMSRLRRAHMCVRPTFVRSSTLWHCERNDVWTAPHLLLRRRGHTARGTTQRRNGQPWHQQTMTMTLTQPVSPDLHTSKHDPSGEPRMKSTPPASSRKMAMPRATTYHSCARSCDHLLANVPSGETAQSLAAKP